MPQLETLSFHKTDKASNKKTGRITVTTTGAQSCSTACRFHPDNGGGCYALSGPLALHWRAVTEGRRGSPWKQHLEALQTLPEGAQLRINQSGDLPANDGRLSLRYLSGLVSAVSHLRAWTYTHQPLTDHNRKALRWANGKAEGYGKEKRGLVVNISTETESDADAAIEQGLPAVLTVSSDEQRNSWRTPAGNVVITCPAQKRDDTNCQNCMLCHNRGRRVVIAFLAHGTQRKRVNRAVTDANDAALS